MGQLTEYLVDTQQFCDTHVELEWLVHALFTGFYQSDCGSSQWLLRMLVTQTGRAVLVLLLDALVEWVRVAKMMDFGVQMACATRLAATFPQVCSRPAQSLPGGGARTSTKTPDMPGASRCQGTVRGWRERRRRRTGVDSGRNSHSVHVRMAWRFRDELASLHHRLPSIQG
ncbi:hypothetical protein [Mycobacterium leprae]|uniref:hypothetical protein n=1 Tax=Mycobacterium leprae TaxID=1769 RepID=UPI000B333A23|nr:hypothetical protein [Mycobacterium leprae]